MKIVVHGMEIECPDKPHQITLVKAMNPMQAHYLRNRQKEPKNWPNHTNIPDYCIYMGSCSFPSEKVDFYHYESSENEYSTGIVCGDEGGDYLSGWPELAAKREIYREQLHREFLCGFLTVDDLIKVGMSTLGVSKEGWTSIRPMRASFKTGAELYNE